MTSDSMKFWAGFAGLALLFAVGLVLLFYPLTIGFGYDIAMQEAFDRGHAVQCLGKTGYYWGCDE